MASTTIGQMVHLCGRPRRRMHVWPVQDQPGPPKPQKKKNHNHDLLQRTKRIRQSLQKSNELIGFFLQTHTPNIICSRAVQYHLRIIAKHNPGSASQNRAGEIVKTLLSDLCLHLMVLEVTINIIQIAKSRLEQRLIGNFKPNELLPLDFQKKRLDSGGVLGVFKPKRRWKYLRQLSRDDHVLAGTRFIQKLQQLLYWIQLVGVLDGG